MVTATLRHLRIAPRKVRLLADLIRGKSAKEAEAILNFTVKKASEPLLKLLGSALANAKNNFQMDPANLYISRITIDEAPKLKRWRPRARGSANEIQKKTSHINLVLDEIVKSKRIKKAKAPEKPAVVGQAEAKKEAAEKTPVQEKPKLKPSSPVKKPAASRAVNKIFRRQVF